MQVIFAGICFLGAVATMIFVKSLDLAAGLTIAIIIPLVFLVVYSLARIKPKRQGAEKDTWK
jgi:amino acid permease